MIPPESSNRQAPLIDDTSRAPETACERRTRREQTNWFGDTDRNREFVAFLEGLDRRREAAMRLPALCGNPCCSNLGCHDPFAAGRCAA